LKSIFVKPNIKCQSYFSDILPVALKDGRTLMGDQFKFKQDGASPHKDHHTKAWRKDNFWDFWRASRWPLNSPDLNPLDYSIWYEICSQMNWDKVTHKKSLIDQIRVGVRKIRTEVVLRSIDCWTKRVYRVLQQECEYVF
jgi:hypothetical protein